MADNDNQHDRPETPQPEGPAPQQGQQHGSARDEARDSSAEQSAATPGDDAAVKPGAQPDEQPAERTESHTDDGAETPDDDETPQSRGLGIRLRELSGPQACLSIVGCGTLAAVLVVALVYGGIRFVANSFTSDEDSSGSPAIEQSGQPVEELAVGGLDLCGRIIPGISTLSLERTDSGEHYRDTAESDPERQRLVSDECSWVVLPQDTPLAEWSFEFEYQALVSAEGSEREQAEEMFEHYSSEMGHGFSEIQDSGPLSRGDEAEYMYGLHENGDSQLYVMLVRHQTAVYVIGLYESPSSAAEGTTPTIDEFVATADPVVEQVNIRLGAVIPQ